MTTPPRTYSKLRDSVGASDVTLNMHALDQPGDRVAGDIKTLAAKLRPDLPGAVDPPVLFEDPMDPGTQSLISACPI